MNDLQFDFCGDILYDVTSVGNVTGTLHLDTGDLLVFGAWNPVVRGRTQPRDVRPEGISLGVPVTTGSNYSGLAREQGLTQNSTIGLQRFNGRMACFFAKSKSKQCAHFGELYM